MPAQAPFQSLRQIVTETMTNPVVFIMFLLFLDRHANDFTGIPHLPRVIDALSTIMWPSMETKTHTRIRKSQPGAQSRAQSSVCTYLDWTTGSGFRDSVDMREEINALERWLEDDLVGGKVKNDDPWSTTSEPITGRVTGSPEPEEGMPKETVGFDDDFTVFVSAPAVGNVIEEDQSFEAESPISGTLAPSVSYRSLGSVSDFGEEENGHDDDDEGLPTQDEIRETSTRIFGSSRDEEAMGSFDLGNVMSALEGIKSEIAGMTDDGERRKAAARVALSLAYGFEANV